jgi:Cell wall-active antibiotics response LiaF, C-terminal
MANETPLLAAQRTAIQDLRARFERGELPIETFRETLDSLVLARDPDECQSLMRQLPDAQLAVLSALEPASALLVTPVYYPHRRIVAFMSAVKKLRRPWRLAPLTRVVAFMGDVQLDLSKADVPPQARIRVYSIMGSVRILAPKDIHVTVRSTALLGDVNALGESVSGVAAWGHEEHEPSLEAEPVDARAQVEIEAFTLMGNVHVKLIEPQIPTIGSLVRDVLQAAAMGVRRGLLKPQRQG